MNEHLSPPLQQFLAPRHNEEVLIHTLFDDRRLIPRVEQREWSMDTFFDTAWAGVPGDLSTNMTTPSGLPDFQRMLIQQISAVLYEQDYSQPVLGAVARKVWMTVSVMDKQYVEIPLFLTPRPCPVLFALPGSTFFRVTLRERGERCIWEPERYRAAIALTGTLMRPIF